MRAAAATVLAATALKGDSSVSSSVPVPAQHTMKTAPTGNDHYTISGGSIRDMRGRYARMAGSSPSTNPTCNNKSIYKKSGGDYYLFLPDGHSDWVVGTTADMNACRNGGYLNMNGGCSSSPTGCAGKWKTATGTDASDDRAVAALLDSNSDKVMSSVMSKGRAAKVAQYVSELKGLDAEELRAILDSM